MHLSLVFVPGREKKIAFGSRFISFFSLCLLHFTFWIHFIYFSLMFLFPSFSLSFFFLFIYSDIKLSIASKPNHCCGGHSIDSYHLTGYDFIPAMCVKALINWLRDVKICLCDMPNQQKHKNNQFSYVVDHFLHGIYCFAHSMK